MSDNRSEDPKYVQWAKAIKTRDNYQCQICFIKSEYKIQLDSHHMDSWDWCVEKRYDINNGVTLCHICHQSYHKYTSFGKNTKENFLPYMKIAKVFSQVLLKDPQVKIAKIFLNILSSEQSKDSLKDAIEIKENLKIAPYEEINKENEADEKDQEQVSEFCEVL